MTVNDQSLSLPRLLCLHGGGVNADVFRTQMRAIIGRLESSFRFVFVDGPLLSPPHPDIAPVYGDHGPFYCWLRWMPGQPRVDTESACQEVWGCVKRGMEEDPGTGEWVGVLGFSQGAKIAASLLWAQQHMPQGEKPDTNFKFGVVMAGMYPIVRLDMRLPTPKHIGDPGVALWGYDDIPAEGDNVKGDHVVSIPTVHVHGLDDPGLEKHRVFMQRYFKPGTKRLVEWRGVHRLPIKAGDVSSVVTAIFAAAEHGGVHVFDDGDVTMDYP